MNVFLVTNKLHLHPTYARRDNCRSSLPRLSLHLLLLASSPTHFIGANQHHVNISVFVIDASSSSFSFLAYFSSRSYLFPRILFLSFFSLIIWNTLSFSNTMHHLVALVLFPSYSWNTLPFYYNMNHLASVV